MHIVTYMVILRLAHGMEHKSTVCDVRMAPIFYGTSLVTYVYSYIIVVAMCVMQTWRYGSWQHYAGLTIMILFVHRHYGNNYYIQHGIQLILYNEKVW